MSNYLLDSDILIWHLRGRHDVVRLLDELSESGSLSISPISVLEVQAGVKPGEEARTTAFLEGLRCVPIDRGIAGHAGEYIRAYRAKGISLDFADSLLAATAALHNLILVTKNKAHFPMPDVQVLQEESRRWSGE